MKNNCVTYIEYVYFLIRMRKSLPNFQVQIQIPQKFMTCLTSLQSSKAVPVPFMFPLFLFDLDKKYKIEIEKDNNQ